jgi:hypothetical protein
VRAAGLLHQIALHAWSSADMLSACIRVVREVMLNGVKRWVPATTMLKTHLLWQPHGVAVLMYSMLSACCLGASDVGHSRRPGVDVE